MLSVMIEGVLTGAPQQRTSKTGGHYATASLRTKGDDGQPVFVNVIVFDAEVFEALRSLVKGDPLALVGSAHITTWEKDGKPRAGLSVTATRVLSIRLTQPKWPVIDG